MTPLDIFLLAVAVACVAASLGLLSLVLRRGRTPETRSLAIFTTGTAIALLAGAAAIAYAALGS